MQCSADRLFSGTLVMDSIYVSLCIELGFNGSSYELLAGILGVSYIAGSLLASR